MKGPQRLINLVIMAPNEMNILLKRGASLRPWHMQEAMVLA